MAQLVNTCALSPRTSVNTFAFFNVKLSAGQDVALSGLDWRKPFCIATVNGTIKQYGWRKMGTAPVVCGGDWRLAIDSTGYYKKSSTDPSIFLEPYFGLFPWDGYYRDDLLDDYLLPQATIRSDIKFLKDFSTAELVALMPPNSVKLLARLQAESPKD